MPVPVVGPGAQRELPGIALSEAAPSPPARTQISGQGGGRSCGARAVASGRLLDPFDGPQARLTNGVFRLRDPLWDHIGITARADFITK